MSSSQVQFALTTTFTPPSPSCTQSHWTLLGPAKSYYIYLNYPTPVNGTTSADCYPSQFLSSYLEQQSAITPLPAIQPLICPVGYASISLGGAPDGYLACCPDSMELALSSPTQSDRPAFGGTCYTPISSVTVTAYGDSSVTATSAWVTPASVGAQAYAIPIEGYAFPTGTSSSTSSSAGNSTSSITSSASSSGNSTISSSASNTAASSTASSAAVSMSSKLSGGAIAGIVIGVLAGVAFIVIGALFILRRRRHNRNVPSEMPSSAEKDEYDYKSYSGHSEQKSHLGSAEMATSGNRPDLRHEMSGDSAEQTLELPGSETYDSNQASLGNSSQK